MVTLKWSFRRAAHRGEYRFVSCTECREGGVLHQPTLDVGLHLGTDGVSSLKWADCPNSQCSTSSYSIFLGDNLVSVFKVAKSVSHSSAEMEYWAVVHAVCYDRVTATPGPAQWLDHVAGYGLGAPNRWFCSLP